MFRRVLAIIVLVSLVTPALISADTSAGSQDQKKFRPTWTLVGAGGGFGLGVWAGLTKFDDALHSDRKVWTTAIVSAAAGGIVGFLVDRKRARSNPSANVPMTRGLPLPTEPAQDLTTRPALALAPFCESPSGVFCY